MKSEICVVICTYNRPNDLKNAISKFDNIKYYFCGRHLAKKKDILSNILSPYN